MKKPKNIANILLAVVFFVGLAVLLYPTISDYVNERHQSHAIATYNEAVAQVKPEDYSAYRQAAQAYNAALTAETANRYVLDDAQLAQYNSLLDVGGTGMMGYIEIERIGVNLPIYHGVDEAVLQVGAGHIPGSSLPVGGAGTHSVLSGHRGLPSAKLLTDLDQMQEGDVFLLHVLDEVLAYEVDQIKIVLPEETDDLEIADGQDYCTLVTCTPYGVNTHRLLVRGHRVDYTEALRLSVEADAVQIDPILVAPVLAVPVLILFLLVLVFAPGGKKKKKGR